MTDHPPNIDYININPVTEQCITEAANRFDLPDIVLRGILAVESGKIGELRVNMNGTYDIGPMQINSSWLPKFKDYVSKQELLYNGCTNIQVGAWILKYNINKAGGNLWKGIGNYHSMSENKHTRYRDKVLAAIQKLGLKSKNLT